MSDIAFLPSDNYEYRRNNKQIGIRWNDFIFKKISKMRQVAAYLKMSIHKPIMELKHISL